MVSPVAEPPHSLYAPLDRSTSQIRLIHLQPRVSPKSDEITCSLHLADLDDTSCQYEALSYEWGKPNLQPLFIELDGKRRAVRENLWWALWNLRYEEAGKSSRVLWIDALCIDQDNEIEKNHQVRQMGRLYERANQVIAWIGREECVDPDRYKYIFNTTNVEPAFKLVHLLHEASNSIQYLKRPDGWYPYIKGANGWSPYMERSSTWSSKQGLKFIPKWSRDWKILLDMFNRTYWTRLWIIQEFVLAKDVVVQCGQFSFSWPALEHASENFTDGYEAPALSLFRQRSLRFGSFSRPYQRNEGLSSLFWVHHKAACLDVRDKIFGLLGMSSNCCQNALGINYNVSTSELCRRLLIHHMQCNASLSETPHISEFVRIACPLFSVDYNKNHMDQYELNIEEFPPSYMECTPLGVVRELSFVENGTRIVEKAPAPTDGEPFFNASRIRHKITWPPEGPLLAPWPKNTRYPKTILTTLSTCSSTVEGDVRIGDLLFQLENSGRALILRKIDKDERLLVVGKAIPSRSPTGALDSRLQLDYRSLCGISLNFPEYIFPRNKVLAISVHGSEDEEEENVEGKVYQLVI